MITTCERNVHIQLVVQVTSRTACYAGHLWSRTAVMQVTSGHVQLAMQVASGHVQLVVQVASGHAQLVMQVASGRAQLVVQVISRTACCTGRLWSRKICCAVLLSLSTGPPSANEGFVSPAGCELLIARHNGTVGASWNFLCKF